MNPLIREAAELFFRTNMVSVSLLQQHFHLGDQAASALMIALEEAKIVTPMPPDGHFELTQAGLLMRDGRQCSTPETKVEGGAHNAFTSWRGDHGSPQSPSIWWWDEFSKPASSYSHDQFASKLLAAMQGEFLEQHEKFMHTREIWNDDSGFLQGCLYPITQEEFENLDDRALDDLGLRNKEELVAWWDTYRLPAIRQAVRKHRPRLFICMDSAAREKFVIGYFGGWMPLQTYRFSVNGYLKKIRYAKLNGRALVIVPSWNGSASISDTIFIQTVGAFIAGLISA